MPDPRHSRSPFGLPPDMRGAVDLSQRAGTDDLTKTIDVHDSEVNEIHKTLEILRKRAATTHNYDSFQREIIDRFARIGFLVDVRWYETNVPDVLIPEINISGRTETNFVFDREKQVSEVTGDLLGLGEGGVLKVDKAMMRALENGSYKGESGHKH
jgi:hypothetical protein